jgi:Rad3-related DNA helicase
MPRAALTFRLPEEQAEFEAACQASAAKSLLWDLDQHCRSILKYEADPHDERSRLAEEIRRMIREAEGVTIE